MSDGLPEVQVWVEPALDEEVGDQFDVHLDELVRHAVIEATRRLPSRTESVSVSVAQEPSRVIIPHLGLGAWATHDIAVAVDPDSDHLGAGLAHLPTLVAHETHHPWRSTSGGGGPQGLAAAAVAERLADHFAREVHPEIPPQPWTRAIPEANHADWWRRLTAADGDDVDMDDHDRWFFGAGDVPAWTGYTLGWELVGDYLACHDTLASDHVSTPWERIVAGAGHPWTRPESNEAKPCGSRPSDG
ncbi:DUF2268 domain-containing putative Zn-dependent protease [Salsipaludibacter albus]|uniref:DUF2268 domain-containing putative Zn-dependent protease n=1 Tax=Salsipaludibacter albus TaxID=2849650 RepID=UPI001EE4687D|nr:DUF2268 domain-containing protein [Salsipaludibacter albus]